MLATVLNLLSSFDLLNCLKTLFLILFCLKLLEMVVWIIRKKITFSHQQPSQNSDIISSQPVKMKEDIQDFSTEQSSCTSEQSLGLARKKSGGKESAQKEFKKKDADKERVEMKQEKGKRGNQKLKSELLRSSLNIQKQKFQKSNKEIKITS